MAENYDQLVAYFDGTLLSQAESLEVAFQAEDQDVFTIVLGFSGQTPSPRKVMVKIGSHLPKSGLEFDPYDAWLKGKKVVCVVQCLGSGLKLKSEGFIREPSAGASVGQSAKIGWEFHGGPGKFE